MPSQHHVGSSAPSGSGRSSVHHGTRGFGPMQPRRDVLIERCGSAFSTPRRIISAVGAAVEAACIMARAVADRCSRGREMLIERCGRTFSTPHRIISAIGAAVETRASWHARLRTGAAEAGRADRAMWECLLNTTSDHQRRRGSGRNACIMARAVSDRCSRGRDVVIEDV